METGTEILIARMASHPEEFVDGVLSKWARIIDKTECLPEEDKEAIRQAFNRAKIEHFNGEVLATLAGERETLPLAEATIKYQAKGRYATGWSDPSLLGRAIPKGEGQMIGIDDSADSYRYVAINPNGRP